MTIDNNKSTAILLIHCPDKQGLLALVTEFINTNNGNILYLDQHVDREEKLFYMRVEWDLSNFNIPKNKVADYFLTLIGQKNQMTFEIHFSEIDGVFIRLCCFFRAQRSIKPPIRKDRHPCTVRKGR